MQGGTRPADPCDAARHPRRDALAIRIRAQLPTCGTSSSRWTTKTGVRSLARSSTSSRPRPTLRYCGPLSRMRTNCSVGERRAAILVIRTGSGRALARGEGHNRATLDGRRRRVDRDHGLGVCQRACRARGVGCSRHRPWDRASSHAIPLAPRIWYNPDLRSTRFLVPGLIGFILMLTAVLSTLRSCARRNAARWSSCACDVARPRATAAREDAPLSRHFPGHDRVILSPRVSSTSRLLGSYLDLFAATSSST